MGFVIFLLFVFLVLPAIGIMTLIIYLIYRAYKKSKVRKDQLLERWQVLVESGSGSAEDVYDAMVTALESAEAPGVTWQRQEIQAGAMLTGKSYNGLVITNSYMKEFKIYIFAYDYGTALHVAWFLSMEVGFWTRAFASGFLKISDPRALVNFLDIPQELTLSAYVSTVHGAAKGAVGALMAKLEQDFSKVNTRSKGFLEVW